MKEILDATKDLSKEIYTDLLHPTASHLGLTIGELVKTLLIPFSVPSKMINIRFDNWVNRISNEVKSENLVEATPNITIPTIQNLALNPDDTILGEMFFNILKASVDKTKKKFLSPAFPKLLEQLTRDECVFILLLSKKNYKIHHIDDYDDKKNVFFNRRAEIDELPKNFFEFPENIWIYSEHLNHLNLAGCWQYKQQEPIFADEETKETNGAFSQTYHKQIGIRTFSEFKLTEFGKMFAEVCITDKCEEFLVNK